MTKKKNETPVPSDPGPEINPAPVEATQTPEPEVIKEASGERSIAGMPVTETTSKILDHWDELKAMPDPIPPMTEEEVNAAMEERVKDPIPYYAKVGFPVLFENSAALITKVWDKGLVNLIVFHDGSPVPDLKTSVPYGEGPNTWKEIN